MSESLLHSLSEYFSGFWALQLLRPDWLWGLLLLIGINLWFGLRSARSRSWSNYCDPELLPYLLSDNSEGVRRWPGRLLNGVVVLTLLALSGPTWERIPQPLLQDQSAMVVLLDLSSSMDATDLKPSRLTRARLKLHDLLQHRRDGQTGLVVFAGSAFVVTPLTSDIATITALLGSLDTRMMPLQGSHPERALQTGVELLQQAGHRQGDLLLITDGVASSCTERCSEIAASVAQSGYRLSVIAVGSEDGAPIPLPQGGFLKDSQGNIVIPGLELGPLQQMAAEGGGVMSLLRVDDADIEMVLALGSGRPDAEQLAETQREQQQWREEGPWLVLLLLPLVALFYRKGLLIVPLILLLPLPQSAEALEWGELWQRPDQLGAKLFEQGEYQRALPLMQDPEWQAATAYRTGDYQRAAELLEGVEQTEALYNRGNAQAQMGELAGAVETYRRALEMEPKQADALYNLEPVEKRLQQQQQRSESQQGEGDSEQESSPGQDSEQQDSEQQGQQSQSGEGEQGEQQSDPSESSGESGESQSSQQQQQQGSQSQPSEQSGGESGRDDSAQQADSAQAESGEEQSQPESQAEMDSEAEQQEEQGTQGTEATVGSESPQRPEMDADAQWLRRIPDDPGGLLRRKFRYQYQQQGRSRTEVREAW